MAQDRIGHNVSQRQALTIAMPRLIDVYANKAEPMFVIATMPMLKLHRV